jgi:hypothetical protein
MVRSRLVLEETAYRSDNRRYVNSAELAGDDMSEDNKRNLLFFEAPTMRELFAEMDEWQATNRKRLQSVSVQPDGNGFACIALSNPTEVIIVNGHGKGGVAVGSNLLAVTSPPGFDEVFIGSHPFSEVMKYKNT